MAGGVSKRRLKSGLVRWRYFGSHKSQKFYSGSIYLSEGDALVARREHLERLASRGSQSMKLGDCIRQRIRDLQLRHTQRHADQVGAQLQKLEDRFGANRELFSISRMEIQDLIDSEAFRLKKQGSDNWMANRLRTDTHALFQWAIDRYELTKVHNPVSKIKRYPLTKVTTKYLPESWELDLIEENLNPKQLELFQFARMTGARIGELLRLRAKDLDFEKRMVTLLSRKSKGNSLIARRIPMPLIMDKIRIPKKPDTRIFRSWNQHPSFLLKTIDKLNRERSKVPDLTHWHSTWTKPKLLVRWNWHSLRHAFTGKLLSEGHNIFNVSRRLGHSNPVMTMHYARSLGFDDLEPVEGYEIINDYEYEF